MPTEKYKIYLPQGMKASLINDAELFEFYKPSGEVNLNGFLKTLLVNYFDFYVSWNFDVACSYQEVQKEGEKEES